MIGTRMVTKGMNRLLIVASISVLVLVNLVVMLVASTEFEQELETKEIPSGFELNIAGASCVVPAKTWTSKMKFKLGKKLLPYCMKLNGEYAVDCVAQTLKLTPGLVECLDSIANQVLELIAQN